MSDLLPSALDGAEALRLGLLAVVGVVAGFLNTVAGGGSLLTVPALMLLGLPPQLANATNRVGVILQALAGVRGFHQHGRIPWRAIPAMAVPTLLGAFGGAQLAAHIPPQVLKPTMLAILLLMAVTLVWKPNAVTPPEGTEPRRVKDKPVALLAFFALGAYGGFLQAGMGIPGVLILGGLLRYDLVRAHAIKVTLVALLTVVALGVFIVEDQIVWLPGLFLGAFMMIGAEIGVRFAMKTRQDVLRKLLFVAVVASCIAALVKG
jgi:uncharacterized membrane protein YfcA